MGRIDKKKKNYEHREDLIALLPPDAKRVLDIGCGRGSMAEHLKERGIEVVGVEKNAEYAKEAEKYMKKVIVGDIEMITLPFEEGYFDCIVFGDVLEHTVNPWKAVEKCKRYLKDGGCFIASIPNISHYSIIQNLLRGKWEYEDSGLMDKSHLRYFTLDTIKRLFSEAGFEIIDIKYHLRTSRFGRILNRLVFNRLIHLLVEQYLIVSLKK